MHSAHIEAHSIPPVSGRKVRSPDCPNDITNVPDEDIPKGAGLCGSCAWGFVTSKGSGLGVVVDPQTLTPVTQAGVHLGYTSQCGQVLLYRDAQGRIGALRTIAGVPRFFLGKEGNWAFERFVRKYGLSGQGVAHA